MQEVINQKVIWCIFALELSIIRCTVFGWLASKTFYALNECIKVHKAIHKAMQNNQISQPVKL